MNRKYMFINTRKEPEETTEGNWKEEIFQETGICK